jgi:hypothetical protein
MPIETDRSKMTVEDLVTRIRGEMIPMGSSRRECGLQGLQPSF